MSEVTVYDADEAASILKCTASWLKEQARKRRIPFTMYAGSYRWTPAHLAEIVRAGEQRPVAPAEAPVRARRAAQPKDEVTALRSRQPRRAKGAA